MDTDLARECGFVDSRRRGGGGREVVCGVGIGDAACA